MRIEVDDGEVGETPGESSQNRISDGMIATKANWQLPLIEQVGDRVLDCGKFTIWREFYVAGIQNESRVKFDSTLGR